MPRRWIETLLAVLAVAALGLVLYNATLVDRRPPTVSRISLSATADGDDHVAQTLTAIDLAFSEPVDRASVEQRFRIEPYVGGTFSWDRDTTAIFTPARKLPSATAFRVIVAAGFVDPAGNSAADPAGPFEFTTVGAARRPVDDAGVGHDRRRDRQRGGQLDFDRLMDTGSVEAALTDRAERDLPGQLERALADDRVRPAARVRHDVHGDRVQRRRRHRRESSRGTVRRRVHDRRRGPRRRRRRAGRRRGRDRRPDPDRGDVRRTHRSRVRSRARSGSPPRSAATSGWSSPRATPPSTTTAGRQRIAVDRAHAVGHARVGPPVHPVEPARAAHDLHRRARADRRRGPAILVRWPRAGPGRSRPAARRRAPRTRSRSCPNAAASGTSG